MYQIFNLKLPLTSIYNYSRASSVSDDAGSTFPVVNEKLWKNISMNFGKWLAKKARSRYPHQFCIIYHLECIHSGWLKWWGHNRDFTCASGHAIADRRKYIIYSCNLAPHVSTDNHSPYTIPTVVYASFPPTRCLLSSPSQ